MANCGDKSKVCAESMALHSGLAHEEEGRAKDGDEGGGREILTVELKDSCVCDPRISERDTDYFKGISYSPAFHISPFCRPRVSLQGIYANFYHHSDLFPAGFSVSVEFNSRPFLYFARIPLYLASVEILQ